MMKMPVARFESILNRHFQKDLDNLINHVYVNPSG